MQKRSFSIERITKLILKLSKEDVTFVGRLSKQFVLIRKSTLYDCVLQVEKFNFFRLFEQPRHRILFGNFKVTGLRKLLGYVFRNTIFYLTECSIINGKKEITCF